MTYNSPLKPLLPILDFKHLKETHFLVHKSNDYSLRLTVCGLLPVSAITDHSAPSSTPQAWEATFPWFSFYPLFPLFLSWALLKCYWSPGFCFTLCNLLTCSYLQPFATITHVWKNPKSIYLFLCTQKLIYSISCSISPPRSPQFSQTQHTPN